MAQEQVCGVEVHSEKLDENPNGVDVKEVKWVNSYFTYLIRMTRKSANKTANFRPSAVSISEGEKEPVLHWEFYRPTGANVTVELHEIGTELVLVFLDKGKIVDVYPLRDMTSSSVVMMNDGSMKRIGGRPVKKLIELKQETASLLNKQLVLSRVEQTICDKIDQAKNAERIALLEQKRAEQAEEKRQREEARALRKARIMSRSKIVVFEEGGNQHRGIPATEDEWRSLDTSTPCVLVSSYDDEEKKYGGVLEFFIVLKDGAKARKRNPVSVFDKPVTVGVKIIGEHAFEISGDFFTAVEVKDRGEVDRLNSAGINSGTHVAIQTGQETFTVFTLSGGKVSTKADRVRPIG